LPCSSPGLGWRVQAEIENLRLGAAASNLLTRVVLPDPEGAVITIILPVVKMYKLLSANKAKIQLFF
jgi:hypothetical protein